MTTHPLDQLPAYTAGTLPPPAADEIADHLRGCATCRADATSWSALASGVRTATLNATPSDPPPFAAIRSRLAPSAYLSDGQLSSPPAAAGRPLAAVVPAPYLPGPAGRRLAAARIGWGLLTRQARLVGWRVWAIAVVVIGAGAAFAASSPAGRAGDLLALVVPLVAAVSLAAACGADGEAAELVRATPTSTRVLLLARLTLVLAVTVGVGAAASAAVALPRGDLVLTELFLTWFGPLVPLSAISFALAVLWRPEAGMTIALGAWVLRVMAPTPILDGGFARALDALWEPGLPLLLGAVGMALATVALAPLAGRHRIRALLP